VTWLVAAASFAGCTMQSFEYQATVTFSPTIGTVRLNHQPIAPGTVWSASYASFADALRDPSIVEIGDQTVTIGPDVCATACTACDFDRASLAFAFDASVSDASVRVTGMCGAGDRNFEVR
jgi:hypothetical protein